jgi:hypothetical protein
MARAFALACAIASICVIAVSGRRLLEDKSGKYGRHSGQSHPITKVLELEVSIYSGLWHSDTFVWSEVLQNGVIRHTVANYVCVADADALPGINLPTRAQLQSFIESQQVQQVLGAAAAMAPQIAASFAPLAQPVFVQTPAGAPAELPMIGPSAAVRPNPLPAERPTPDQDAPQDPRSLVSHGACGHVNYLANGPCLGLLNRFVCYRALRGFLKVSLHCLPALKRLSEPSLKVHLSHNSSTL